MTLRALATAAAILLLPAGQPGVARAAPSAAPASAAEWGGERWWLAYDDPQLHALVEQGLRQAPHLKGAVARARQARAMAQVAQAAGRPHLSLRGRVTRLDAGQGRLLDLLAADSGVDGLAVAGVSSGYELDLRGRVRAQAAAARAEARAATADSAEEALRVSTSIARAYGELAALHDLRDIAARAAEVRREMLASAQRRLEGGLAPSGDVDLAAAALARAMADVAAADEALVRAAVELAELIGVEPDAMAHLGRRPMPAANRSVPRDSAAEGPRLAASAARTDAARHRVDAERAARLPSLRLLAAAGTVGGGALLSEEGLSAFGAALQLPILDGGRRRAAVRAAEAARDVATANHEAARLARVSDAAALTAAESSLAIQLERSRAASAASASAWAAQRRRYEAGDVDSMAVLVAEDRLLADRRRVLSLEANRFRLEIDRVELSGGGWQAPEAR